ncbi:methyl-accepting chemotaxis protein [Thiospirillum jenense]|uniref:Methyl-accepting chemotaxis protein n=1 Tax=Thiospirillum jenense TaxID=1653858 RepID=A0A839HIS2_9GAMM|nr:methyl-accepting chemotaxis protein [Thiospirillum jenense]MBB1126747.1 methyl-accepting chemotaxis protein [Thiospirillum jenense]
MLKNLPTRYKFWLIIALTVVGMLALSGLAVAELNKNLLNDRKVKTQHVVETAYGVLEYFYQREQAGEMTRPQAQQAAIALIKTFRYGEDDYFWINDMRPTMVMHPFKPKLDGQDVSDNKDPNGKRLFIAFIDEVRRHQAGFVDYQWAKPGYDEPVPKVSYVKGFQPWDWIIGSGLYIDDVRKIFLNHALHLAMGAAVILAVLMILSLMIAGSLTNPLAMLRQMITEVRDTGDLRQRITLNERNEIGVMADAFDTLLERFQRFVAEVHRTVGPLVASGQRLDHVTQQNSGAVARTQSQTDEVTTAMNEMVQTVQQVARDAAQAAQAAHTAEQETVSGQRVVATAVATIGSLAQEIENATQVVQRLSHDSDNIGKVLEVIRSIAEQTNLLALNAAIEAARAGEQGRGFAVVADEVRTLAQRTQESTREIQQIIETLQQRCREAVQTMATSRDRSHASVEQAAQVGASLTTITAAVTQISQMNLRIASAAEEQSAVANEINHNLSEIAQAMQHTADCTEETMQAGQELRNLAGVLEGHAQQFRY